MIISFIKDDEGTKGSNTSDDNCMVVYDKLNTLIEVFQYYPLIVKKDKNASSSIYLVLNANKSPGAKDNLER